MEIRRLLPEEIELKVQSFSEGKDANGKAVCKGAILVPYINRTAGITILNETFGPTGWQIPADGYHIEDNRMTCNILVYDDEKKEWISKLDGTSHDAQAKDDKDIKGEMSDAFKRTVMTLGIGIELNSSPFIFIAADKMKVGQNKAGKFATYDKFVCTDVDYSDNGHIIKMVIVNQNTGEVVYNYQDKLKSSKPSSKSEPKTEPKASSSSNESKPTEVPKPVTENADASDYIINIGFAKGKTLKQFYEAGVEKVKQSKGTDFTPTDVFRWYLDNLKGDAQHKELLQNIITFCAKVSEEAA